MLRILLLTMAIAFTGEMARAQADASTTDANPFAATRDKLGQPIGDLRLKDLTAEKALKQWSRAFGIALKVDWDGLAKLQVTRDSPVSIHLHDVRGDKGLQQILTLLKDKPAPVFVIDTDGSVVVTDHDTLITKYTVTHEYLVKDLVDAAGGSSPSQVAAQIAKYVTDNVSPESWKTNGGDRGDISYKDGKLIIRQTEENHQQIPDALAELRKANAK